jgi:hypothetical protein
MVVLIIFLTIAVGIPMAFILTGIITGIAPHTLVDMMCAKIELGIDRLRYPERYKLAEELNEKERNDGKTTNAG